MKPTSVIGIFQNSGKDDKISNSLQIAGFDMNKFRKQPVNENMMAVSVCVKDKYELEMAENIFNFYKTKKILQTDDVSTVDLASYIHAHSRAEISESPVIRHRTPHSGITSEVHFGS